MAHGNPIWPTKDERDMSCVTAGMGILDKYNSSCQQIHWNLKPG
jgi:hypothetical protein